LNGDDGARVGDGRDRLDVLGDEMADIDRVIDVKLGQDVVGPSRRVDFGCDLAIGKRARDRVGLAELAFDLDEERLHRRQLRFSSPALGLAQRRAGFNGAPGPASSGRGRTRPRRGHAIRSGRRADAGAAGPAVLRAVAGQDAAAWDVDEQDRAGLRQGDVVGRVAEVAAGIERYARWQA
jgi:hypothetical protein